MTDPLDINALSRETGVPVRTIRYYLAEKLLPASAGRGPAASYGPGHRDRLLLIRRLQEAHQPLATIRAQLEALDDAGVAAALVEPGAVQDAPATAYDYVRQVLGKPARHGEALANAARPEPAATPAPPTVRRQPRSTWERIALHPDIELHVRRPLARADQRRLDALLEQAQRLFSTEP
ncbi:MerR family transcriptional regulator [Candidatus Thiodictyon syntrophicum]|jgi:DNA-binding transcriptional MerR regulator|uniref:MerR family transcriptional regulator n=1 Tax=Candidatus Thiodictyon syntrophicum TaxID=1166950 RepID=A0A2K8U5M4_9GAMM|nr:MerR family transcriptional regulator [Candidatus Thiodictyon syntrophicum]AUB80857.1 MerR family transcriptional regulator [Candidatus Thiodictyon syntrophicum]